METGILYLFYLKFLEQFLRNLQKHVAALRISL